MWIRADGCASKLNPNSEGAGVIRWNFDHGLHGLHGFKNALNRFENRFHKLFTIRVNPCNPWFNFCFRVERRVETHPPRRPGIASSKRQNIALENW
jgi:hypothetical protein